MRHGESEANVAGLISSAPDEESGFKHGLSSYGLEQAARVHEDVYDIMSSQGVDVSPLNTFIYASDFRRTR